jgi:hypothetical protein
LFHVDRQTDRHDEANSRFSQFCEKRPIKRRTANWIDHMLRTNCLRSKVIEIKKKYGKRKRRRRRRNQHRDDLIEKGIYWNLKKKQQITLCGELPLEEAMDLLQGRLYSE